MNRNLIFLKNNLVEVQGNYVPEILDHTILGTLFSNFAYYGFMPSKEVVEKLMHLSVENVQSFWSSVEPELKIITGDDKNMADFVVYKNFPKEVLDKSSAEYWFSQILMYLGFPNDLFTEETKNRESMLEKLALKTLHLANNKSLQKICAELLGKQIRWIEEQKSIVKFLITNESLIFDPASIVFKENMVWLVAKAIESNVEIKMRSATDILRLAIGMSDGDVSLRTPSRLRTFSRAERRFFLNLLEKTTALEEDMARHIGVWKKFMKALHPNDYKFRYPKVCAAYDKLYNDILHTFNAEVERRIECGEVSVLKLLQKRPGEFMRRLAHMMNLFGKSAETKFAAILPKLSVGQLLKIAKYIETQNNRNSRTIAPKGNWTKLQILENDRKIPENLVDSLLARIHKEIGRRVTAVVGGVSLDESSKNVKLQTNDSDLTDYGRGTVFPIPDDVTFIRTASYWATTCQCGNAWFDNGWNFFDENWKDKGVCCWTNERFHNAAVFSGDPTNSKEMKGRACQMIDLYIDKLVQRGVRYAVWNLLCYSHITFNQADDVHAAMQWGEKPQAGKLFEPSRCQLSFAITGDSFTKYIAYIDLIERKVIYMDANLPSNVSGAGYNNVILQIQMPAFEEYLRTLPSVYDLFRNARKNKNGIPVTYNDANLKIKKGSAYVFKPVNEDNSFEPLNLSKVLNA